MIVMGERLYGRVSRVPGVCCVATQFYHLYYLPILPLQSWIVWSETRKGLETSWSGVRVPLRWTSVVLAWSLGAAIWAGIAAAWPVAEWVLQTSQPFPFAQCLAFVALTVIVIAVPRSPWIRNATLADADRYCAIPGMPESVKAEIRAYMAAR